MPTTTPIQGILVPNMYNTLKNSIEKLIIRGTIIHNEYYSVFVIQAKRSLDMSFKGIKLVRNMHFRLKRRK